MKKPFDPKSARSRKGVADSWTGHLDWLAVPHVVITTDSADGAYDIVLQSSDDRLPGNVAYWTNSAKSPEDAAGIARKLQDAYAEACGEPCAVVFKHRDRHSPRPGAFHEIRTLGELNRAAT